MNRLPFAARIWVLLVCALGVFFLYCTYEPLTRHTLIALVFFTVLTMVTEALPVRLCNEGSTVSVSFASIFAGVLLCGPFAGAIIAAIGTISITELTGERPFYRIFYNSSQLALAAGLSGLVFTVSGGTINEYLLISHVLPVLLAAAIYFLVNTTLTMAAITLSTGLSPIAVWKKNLRWAIPSYLGLAPIGFLIAVVYLNIGALGVLFFLIPLLLARHSFKLYTDMRHTYVTTIRALTRTIDLKDKYTAGHSERVAALSVATGQGMGLTDKSLETLEYIGILHDIGKLGIEDRVLNKSTRFTDKERDLMRQHSRLGANLVKEISFLRPYADWVLYHHEWYNGGGYPEGIKGEEIPLEARIIAVADAYDAMTSKRHYREMWPPAKAVEELYRCSGTQFDPKVVEAFVRMLKRSGELGEEECEAWQEAAPSAD